MTPGCGLAAGLTATPDTAGRIVVRRPAGGLVRLTGAQWAALEAFANGDDCAPAGLAPLLAAARAHGLLADGAPTARRRSVEVAVPAPVRALRRAAPISRVLFGPAGLLAGTALAIAGFVVALASGRLTAALSGPVSPTAIAALALALVCATLLHELAHAASLAALGGCPGRLGLRLWPGFPTGFCDVADVWLLPPDGRRRAVPLAGIWTHAVAGGTASTVLAGAPGLAGTTTGTALALFALTALLAALGNAVPLGHTDGSLGRALARDTR